jgi:hypothetical protein
VWRWTVLLVAVSALCGYCGYVLGVIQTGTQINHRTYLREAAKIERVMNQFPEFRTLDIAEDSEGYAYLLGELPSEHARNELRRLLIQQGGEEWADRCLSVAVEVVPGAGTMRNERGRTAKGQPAQGAPRDRREGIPK